MEAEVPNHATPTPSKPNCIYYIDLMTILLIKRHVPVNLQKQIYPS